LIEDISDIKAIEDRKSEPGEDYEAYSKKEGVTGARQPR